MTQSLNSLHGAALSNTLSFQKKKNNKLWKLQEKSDGTNTKARLRLIGLTVTTFQCLLLHS
jgi:hypothetical protein